MKSQEDMDRHNELSKKSKHKTKVLAFIKLGGKCECCGENRIEFLIIHHKDNNGSLHRETLGGPGPTILHRWINKSDQDEIDSWNLQILCSNCHQAITNYGYCLHKGLIDASK